MPDSIRRHFRSKRQSITGHQRARLENNICKFLHQLLTEHPVEAMVGIYAAFDGEPDIGQWVRETSCQTALPKISQSEARMSFHVITAQEGEYPQVENKFGILEPDPAAPMVEPHQLEVILIPLVAFDEQGMRMGMGAGYYDRFLPHAVNAIRVGVAFDCQCSDDPLPKQPWDQPLDQIVTESGIMSFSD